MIRLPEIDLIVLPEMFLTGYTVDAQAVASRGEEALEWMRDLARRENSAVCGTAAVAENDPALGSLSSVAGAAMRYFNRMFFVRPDGSFTKYDKRHLFSFAGEERTFTPGRERVVVEWRGVRILLQTCYDLRFPVFSRQRPDPSQRPSQSPSCESVKIGGETDPRSGGDRAEYDLIVYSADWPESRIDAWDILLKARAIENVCYVVGVNEIHSQLIDYKGHTASSIDLEALRDFRRKFPVLQDADDFELHV